MKTGHLSRFEIEPSGITGIVDRRIRKRVTDIVSGDPTRLPEDDWARLQQVLVAGNFSRGELQSTINGTPYTIRMQASMGLPAN